MLWESKIRLVGARGFEPPTSASRTLRANLAALRPVGFIIGLTILDCKRANHNWDRC